ncbi:MAG: hypothetical protein J3R72DRAFT_495641 [Linnemannia gamsii]|nr:MAG: hypothetical protein J3R72DRAFT_495641 [Linnemannia gamsii]
MYQLPRLPNNTSTFLRDMVISYGELPPFEPLPLDPLALLPPPPPPPLPPALLPVQDHLFHQTQMDTVQGQFQVMAINTVEGNQDQDQDLQDQDQDQDEDEDENEVIETMDAGVEGFGFEE